MSVPGCQFSRIAGAVDVIVIGAGHAGLSVSRLLADDGVDHVVLERGEIGNAWRERWESLTLLTPNWQTRLPGKGYDGDDPEGFMSTSDLVKLLEDYATEGNAPVMTQTSVSSVKRDGSRYRVMSNRGTWSAKAVVLATGAFNKPSVPRCAEALPTGIRQMTPNDYRSAEDVPEGGVLVVGASATGLQFANELLDAGRDVTIAAGEHVRMPRRYRGKDIFHWLETSGIHDQCYDEIDDINRGRGLPSPQLVGSKDLPILDLNHLTGRGARVTGRLMGARDNQLQFSGSLRNVCALADLKLKRLLAVLDQTADAEGAPAGETFEATRVDDNPALTLDLEKHNIRTVIWATGFRPDYSWLDVDVLDRKGRLKHDGGVVDAPGLYVLGLPLMRRRKSSFIFGIEDDARDIADHLAGYLQKNSRGETDELHQDEASRRSLRRHA